MTKPVHVAAAVDLGSSSGRIVVGKFDGERLEMEPVYRFENEMVPRGDRLTWDVERIFTEITNGLRKVTNAGLKLDSLAVDTWGVDYVLLDAEGHQVGSAHAYRDTRTVLKRDEFTKRWPQWQAFSATGVQPADINTVNQLYADLSADPSLRERVTQLQLLPDYFAYRLSGQQNWGWAIAGTTGLTVAGKPQWSFEVFRALGLEENWLGPIRPGRRVLGPLSTAVGIGSDVQVIDVGGHDTACAVHATGQSAESVFISCGSWSILGCPTTLPVLSSEAFKHGFSNEVRVDGGNRLIKNITGLWILQECQREWEAAGEQVDIASLLEEAVQAQSLEVVFDPNDPVFGTPGEMQDKILRYCTENFGVVPKCRGQLIRLLLESLAVAYRDSIADLAAITGRAVETVHIIGGGARNDLLCQLTADATGLPVLAGPAEATAAGNVLAQLEASGVITDSTQLRDIVAQSFGQVRYEPDLRTGAHLRLGNLGSS